MESVIAKQTQYIMLDDSKTFYPSQRLPPSDFPHFKIRSPPSRPPSSYSVGGGFSDSDAITIKPLHSNNCHVPVAGIKFDLRSLNMHLSLKVREVLACAEEMWGWVQDYQNKQPLQTPYGHSNTLRVHTGGRASSAYCVRRPYHDLLVSMSRSDFDEILSRFELSVFFSSLAQPIWKCK